MDNNQKAFFELLRAGLFPVHGESVMVHDTIFMDVDWGKVYQIAQEQSVLGIVLQGIEELKAKNIEIKVPKVLLLQWIGEVQVIEQRNKDMNAFIAKLTGKLRNEDIYTLLVKGQGIAQCYEKPLWRACGDVDYLLDKDNYERAKEYLLPLASTTDEEDKDRLHIGFVIDQWIVELHGSLRSLVFPQINILVDDVQSATILGNNIRVWRNQETDVYLPAPDNDVIFIFTHILPSL